MIRWIVAIVIILSIGMPVTEAAQSGGLSVLIIGDSNTENGYFSTALADTLQQYFGVPNMGKGYRAVDASFYSIQSKLDTGITITYNTQWTLVDMYGGSTRPSTPFLSPDGHWLKSSTLNAVVTVVFPGTGVDLYSLVDTVGGSFSISIDGHVIDTVNTIGTRWSVQKTPLTGFTSGSHTMLIKVLSIPTTGKVTLLGFDAHTDIVGHPKRTEVHNWGNGGCATSDFKNIDSVIFVTGIQQVAPDVIMLLLGTNDSYLYARSATDVRKNLIVILNRIKAAGVTSNILLASTFMTSDANCTTYMPKYLDSSYQQAATTTGVQYWNLNAWFGPYKSANMLDTWHCNKAAGTRLGIEMKNQIFTRFPIAVTGVRQDRHPLLPATQAAISRVGLTGIVFAGTSQHEIALYRLDGSRAVRINASSPSTYAAGIGVLAVSPGVYVLRAKCGGEEQKWTVVVSH